MNWLSAAFKGNKEAQHAALQPEAIVKRIQLPVVAFLCIAVLTRLTRYMVAFPLWGDEAAVALNLAERSCAELLSPLDYAQIAPWGWLISVRALLGALGVSDLSLRLAPFASSLASVFTFCWLATITQRILSHGRPKSQPESSPLMAVAVFAVSYYLVRYGSEVKPYASDVLISSGLLLTAAGWIHDTQRGRESARYWYVGFMLLSAAGPWFSYPSIFVAAGISIVAVLACAPGSTRSRWLLPICLSGLLTAVSFLVAYHLMLRPQREGVSASFDLMGVFWDRGFPPHNPLRAVWWFLVQNTGEMFAYPNGGKNAGSVVSFTLFIVGAWHCWKTPPAGASRDRRMIVAMLTAPFVLLLVAACARKYPYGGHIRPVLFLAPAICLLIGFGVEALLLQIRSRSGRAKGRLAVLAVLAMYGLATAVGDVHRPYRTEFDVAIRREVAALDARIGRGDIVVDLRDDRELVYHKGPVGELVQFRWYLRHVAGSRFRAPPIEAHRDLRSARVWGVLLSDESEQTVADRTSRFAARLPHARLALWERIPIAYTDKGRQIVLVRMDPVAE